MNFSIILTALALTAALSIDAFAASFAYGASKIKIPLLQVFIINLICTAVLALSLLLGTLLSAVILPDIAKYISFALLMAVGCIKFFGELLKTWLSKSKNKSRELSFKLFHIRFMLSIICDCTKADADENKVLSIFESLTLALALSLDSLGVGLSVGLQAVNHILIITLSFGLGMVAVCLGSVFGKLIAKKIRINLSWLSGLILIALAVLKLF